MLEQGDDLGLELESLSLSGIHRCGREKDLQRHAAPQRELLGLVHDSHAAAADLTNDPIIAQPFRRQWEILASRLLGIVGSQQIIVAGGKDKIETVQAVGEFIRNGGMTGQELASFGLLAEPAEVDILIQHQRDTGDIAGWTCRKPGRPKGRRERDVPGEYVMVVLIPRVLRAPSLWNHRLDSASMSDSTGERQVKPIVWAKKGF